MRYDFDFVFSDADEGFGWLEHTQKLRAILQRLAAIDPRYANWYLMRATAQESYPFDILNAPQVVADHLAQEDQNAVSHRFLIWNGRDSDPSAASSANDPEWVQGTYAAGSRIPQMIKNSFNLELHPLAKSPGKALDGFLSVCEAVLVERTVTWSVLTTQAYRMKHRVFPHRRWGGWLVYVPQQVAHQDIPQAADVIGLSGKGSIILTTHELFDVSNPLHLKAANEIEIRLVEMELLPELHA